MPIVIWADQGRDSPLVYFQQKQNIKRRSDSVYSKVTKSRHPGYKPAVRDKLTDIWKTMDAINFVKNRKWEDEAESRHRINDAVWNRILHFHAVLNLKLKLCDYVMISLIHGKICIHHFQSRRIAELLRNCISVNFAREACLQFSLNRFYRFLFFQKY